MLHPAAVGKEPLHGVDYRQVLGLIAPQYRLNLADRAKGLKMRVIAMTFLSQNAPTIWHRKGGTERSAGPGRFIICTCR